MFLEGCLHFLTDAKVNACMYSIVYNNLVLEGSLLFEMKIESKRGNFVSFEA